METKKTMKAERFLTSSRAVSYSNEKENVITRILLERDIEISKNDFDFIYCNLMNDDYECANDNGLYSDNYEDYHSLDCNKVAEHMHNYKEEYKDNYDCEFNETTEEFREQFSRILELLEKNEEFTIYYHHEVEK